MADAPPSRRALLLAGAALLSGGAAAQPSSALENVFAGIARLPARQARFVEEKRLSSLTRPLVSRGILIYRPPDYLEKDTEAPVRERLVIDDDTVTIAEGDAAPRTIPLDRDPALRGLADTLRAVLAGDLAALRRLYTLEELGDSHAWRLLMVPRAAALRRALVRVTVDGAGTDIRQIDVQQRNGDEQRIIVQAAR